METTETPGQRRTFKEWVKKYFLDGQQLEEEHESATEASDFIERHRRFIALLIPFILIQLVWWTTAYRHGWFSLFVTRWQMPLTMLIGSTIAGMTSEGGGAVAFPVMTLALHIDADTARDFSLMIQSFGMTSALFVVLFMRVRVEKVAVVCATLGSVPGMILGFEVLDPLFTGEEKKMLFVSIWGSFAIALFILNSHKKRTTFPEIPEVTTWKILTLVSTGFVGGIFTSFAGSGIDICTFSMITLLFRVTEKTATPTTVVIMETIFERNPEKTMQIKLFSYRNRKEIMQIKLFSYRSSKRTLHIELFFYRSLKWMMQIKLLSCRKGDDAGLNTLVGFYWRGVWQREISPDAWEWLAVSIPVAATFAPLGSFLGSFLHRMVLAWLVYILEVLSLIGFLFTSPPLRLLIAGSGILLCGLSFFSLLSYQGSRIAENILERRRKPSDLSISTTVSIEH